MTYQVAKTEAAVEQSVAQTEAEVAKSIAKTQQGLAQTAERSIAMQLELEAAHEEQRTEMKEKLYSKTDIMNPKLTEAMSSEDSLEFGRTRSELGTTIEASEKPGMYNDPFEVQRAFLADETAGMTANGGPAPAQAQLQASDSDTLVRVSTGLHPGLAPEQERL